MKGSLERFVILSDVHANGTALEAVLARVAEIEAERGCSFQILVNGDFLDAGPHPQRTAELLQQHAQVFVCGNHEEYLLDCSRHPANQRYHDPLWRYVPWTVKRLGHEVLEMFARKMVFGWQSPSGVVQLVHASRESSSKMPAFFGAQDRARNRIPQTQLLECDKVFFAGHSHYLGVHWEPGHRNVWINTGSVGYPFLQKAAESQNCPAASFVWVEVQPAHQPLQVQKKAQIEVHFECVYYSRAKLLQDTLNSGVLEQCAPYSVAILAQSLFNEDLVFPFFQQARKQGISQTRLAAALVHFLNAQNIYARLQSAFDEEQIEVDLSALSAV